MFHKILYLFDTVDKKNFSVILIMMIIATFFEILSIGLLVPFVSILLNDNYLDQFNFIKDYFPFIGDMQKEDLIYLSLIIFLCVFLIKLLFMNLLIVSKNTFLYKFAHKTAEKLFKSYLSRKYEFHVKNNSSKIINNLQIEVQDFTYNVLLSGLELLTEILIFIGLLILLFFIEPIGSLIMCVTGFLFIFIFRKLIKNKTAKWSLVRQTMYRNMVKQIQQGIGGIREVKIMLKEISFIKYFSEFMKNASDVNAKSQSLIELPRYFIEFFALNLFLLFIFIAITNGMDLIMIIPTLSVFAAVAFKFLPAANRISAAIVRISETKAVIDSIYDEIKYFNDEGITLFKNLQKPSKEFNFQKQIELKKIFFKYPNNARVILDNIDIKIKKGEVLGIIGESGQGKTTLINVLTGLLKPNNGNVIVDEQDIYNNIRGWRSRIGYIPQNPFMLDDTIYNNVTFEPFKNYLESNSQKFHNCLKDAQIYDFVQSLKDKHMTLIGERGTKVSGGQIQRISIARALYQDPKILILDEATNALDEENERRIIETIDKIKKERTVIVISHKKSALKICNRVLKLDNGKLSEINLK